MGCRRTRFIGLIIWRYSAWTGILAFGSGRNAELDRNEFGFTLFVCRCDDYRRQPNWCHFAQPGAVGYGKLFNADDRRVCIMAVAGFFCTANWFCDGVECACFMESHAMDMDIESLS